MRKITSMTFALGAFLIAGVGAHADDQQRAASLREIDSIQKEARLPRQNDAAYGAYAQSGTNNQSRELALGGGYAAEICNYVGGPKVGARACR
jgi:hypothetical protein